MYRTVLILHRFAYFILFYYILIKPLQKRHILHESNLKTYCSHITHYLKHKGKINDDNYPVLLLSNELWQFPFAGISVIDQQPKSTQNVEEFRTNCLNGKDFENKLKPNDIKLSSAMAMSAAALSPYLGKYKETEQTSTHILTLIGMEMAANLVYDMEGERTSGVWHVVRFYR